MSFCINVKDYIGGALKNDLFKQATRAGAKPQPEERSLFNKNRDTINIQSTPSQVWFEKNDLIRGVIFVSLPQKA